MQCKCLGLPSASEQIQIQELSRHIKMLKDTTIFMALLLGPHFQPFYISLNLNLNIAV